MKVEWKRVTWYSKLIALGLFILMPFAGFLLGMKYQQILDTVADLPPKTPHIRLQTIERQWEIQSATSTIPKTNQ